MWLVAVVGRCVVGCQQLNLAYVSLLKFLLHLVFGARWLLMLHGDSLILLDVMKVDFTTYFYPITIVL
jgi:hypothetical protein